MNVNKVLGSIGAFLVAILAIGFAAATLAIDIDEINVNGVEVNGSETVTLSVAPGETIPVVVKFTSSKNLEDLKLKVWIDGYKNEISASTSRFDVKNGSTYIKRLSLTLPSVEDMKDVNEDLTLYVRIADKTDEVEATYDLSVERNSYVFNVLSVEMPNTATAGDIIALDIVLKNIGAHELEDAFVVARIPELGVSKRAYFGDLAPEDDTDSDRKQDARERRIYLAIPADAESGDYAVEVKAYNYDATEVVKGLLKVTGLAVDNSTAVTVQDKEGGVPTSIVVLTVVLVIIFVVLLVVLVVLLTKKPSEKVEDFGETSYY